MLPETNAADWWRVVWHGLTLDASVAGYMTAVPTLLAVVSVWTYSTWLRRTLRLWFVVAAIGIAATFIINIGLYGFWKFPLDSTPLFYFTSSPRDALASASGWMIAGGLLALTLYAILLYGALHTLLPTAFPQTKYRWRSTFALLLLAAVLFIPIRGGVTVSTMNTGKVYFSEHTVLNHAAVNPAFSLLESLLKQKDFGSQYRFMSPEEADKLFKELTVSQDSSNPAARLPLSHLHPDIYLIILESFSSHLMSSLGGIPNVAVCLDSIASQGLLFTNFYANSFRTDRGLVAILSGYPAQPTTSIMKYPRKTQNLPSIAGALRKAGYATRYYYGGDADFTHMRSYLVSSGFQRIVSDTDFPLGQRLSKWGVPDHVVLERVLAEVRTENSPTNTPVFTVVQTSSSHEPFDVPYHRLSNPRLNAFAYTDSVIGSFVNGLQQSDRWSHTLVLLVPDHLGAYPEDIDNFSLERYQIPLILTGGALAAHGRNTTFGSQIDLAATLLSAMRIPHTAFPFSKNLFDSSVPHYAFFTFPDAFGMVTADNAVIYDNQTQRIHLDQGDQPGKNLPYAKAFLQKLYDDLAAR